MSHILYIFIYICIYLFINLFICVTLLPTLLLYLKISGSLIDNIYCKFIFIIIKVFENRRLQKIFLLAKDIYANSPTITGKTVTHTLRVLIYIQ